MWEGPKVSAGDLSLMPIPHIALLGTEVCRNKERKSKRDKNTRGVKGAVDMWGAV